MSKEAKIGISIEADGQKAAAEMRGLASVASETGRAIAASFTAVSVHVKAAGDAVNKFKSIVGFWSQVLSAAYAAVGLFQKAVSAVTSLGKASEEAAAKAKAAVEAAAGAGLDMSVYDYVRDAMTRAGKSADELNEKLKLFKEHKITFEELAAAAGMTGDAMKNVASYIDAGNVGRRFLAEEGRRQENEKSNAEKNALEREGLKTIADRIVSRGDKFGRGREVEALWDKLMEAAGGDRQRAGEIFNENVSFMSFRKVGAGLFGDEALRAAESRYSTRRAEAHAARAAEIAAHDAQVEAERKAAADKAAAAAKAESARKAAADKAAADKAAAEAAKKEEQRQAAVAKENDRHNQALADYWRNYNAAKEGVAVSAPSAISSLGTQGGLLGGRDPAADNAARMNAERNRKLDEIKEKFDLMYDKIANQHAETMKALGE